MTEIVINLERGPDNQPVGELRNPAGDTMPFTGWLALVRLLEDELTATGSPAPDPGDTEADHPSRPD